jgi:phosphatidylglycerol lysyltransferase
MKHLRPMTFVRLLLLAGCLWALRRELPGLGQDALHPIADYGWSRIVLGLAGTAASFALLSALELLALRSSDGATARVPSTTVLGTAFVANAFSQSIGFALLTGAAVRARAYGRYGMDAAAVARLSGTVMVSVVLGLLSVASWALVATGKSIAVGPQQLPGRPLGAALGMVVLAYLVWTYRYPTNAVTHSPWRLPRPTSRVAIAQIALASADWLVTGAVLYLFLPFGLTAGVWPFLATYAIAQAVAMVSHVPGGAGVLELMLVSLLAADAPPAARAALLAAIIMFRALYYLLPLCLAILLVAGAELRRSLSRKVDRDPSAALGLVTVPTSTHA